ncbi:hypothetical protein HUJ04_005391 [Dendroctonus ponderosae]|nr:hypothetical protein HUJ04_005391 [Dendroctonus ponderosae]
MKPLIKGSSGNRLKRSSRSKSWLKGKLQIETLGATKLNSLEKGPSYFSHFLSTFESIGDMTVMLIFSIPATLCFEFPFSRMCGLVFRPSNKEDSKKVAPLKIDT